MSTIDPIKAAHRAMWSLGDFDRVSTEVAAGLGPALVAAAGIRAGERVLDVAAGSGAASFPAAATGAVVTATDLTPDLVETGRQRSAAMGVDITWQVMDAEHLEFPDASFGVVMSCVGVMFAPFHQPVADELIRVVRPGGRIALLNWTPGGFLGQLLAAMRPYVPAPPPGADPGSLWGDEAHVRGLFGDRILDLRAERRTLSVDRFASAREFRDFYAAHYGPTILAYRSVADSPARTAELDRVLIDVATAHGADTGRMEWEYLIVVATVGNR